MWKKLKKTIGTGGFLEIPRPQRRKVYDHSRAAKADAAGFPGEGGQHGFYGRAVISGVLSAITRRLCWTPIRTRKSLRRIFYRFCREAGDSGRCVCDWRGTADPARDRGVLAGIKRLGYLVKLDTNGSFPEKLRRIVEEDWRTMWQWILRIPASIMGGPSGLKAMTPVLWSRVSHI